MPVRKKVSGSSGTRGGKRVVRPAASPVPLKRAAAQKTAGIKKGKAESSVKGKAVGKKTMKKSPAKKIPAYKLKRYKSGSAGISTRRSAGNLTTVFRREQPLRTSPKTTSARSAGTRGRARSANGVLTSGCPPGTSV